MHTHLHSEPGRALSATVALGWTGGTDCKVYIYIWVYVTHYTTSHAVVPVDSLESSAINASISSSPCYSRTHILQASQDHIIDQHQKCNGRNPGIIPHAHHMQGHSCATSRSQTVLREADRTLRLAPGVLSVCGESRVVVSLCEVS
jgi:hypothetical protein